MIYLNYHASHQNVYIQDVDNIKDYIDQIVNILEKKNRVAI